MKITEISEENFELLEAFCEEYDKYALYGPGKDYNPKPVCTIENVKESDSTFLCTIIDDKPVAFIAAKRNSKKDTELYFATVKPFRRIGIGSKNLDRLLSLLSNKGLDRPYLYAKTKPQKKAYQFLIDYGFEINPDDNGCELRIEISSY